jgi:hypothetical protein
MQTLFTFGYSGWGNATQELIKAIDAAERRRGFRPPVFFDIRCNRNVRARGFRGDAFERLLPRGRHQWLPRLGNIHIATGERGIKIADPFAAKFLLEAARKYAQDRRRVVFFCGCKFPRRCHRRVVAKLVLREAERTGQQASISEWPGGRPVRIQIHKNRVIDGGIRDGLKNVRLASPSLPRDLVGLPWGSIVYIESGEEYIPIVSGPARFQKGWTLPVLERPKPNISAAKLRNASEKFLKSKGLGTIHSLPLQTKRLQGAKAISIRQPWAHAIIRLGKDIENRSWRRKYTGPLLIQASVHHEPNPHRVLADIMTKPPSPAELSGLPTGAIIGVVDLVDYTEDSKSRWAGKGKWHLHLRNARPTSALFKSYPLSFARTDPLPRKLS